MSKQYGLILPGQQKKDLAREGAREFTKPSIFDESSSESDEDGPPQMNMKKAPMGPSIMERRKAKNMQEKALAEDPTIFQYDELYDEMENKREVEKQVRSNQPKKAKYITKLLEAAERRKLENELRVERQVQKEREAEGDEFKDKEAFVTSAYRQKLEEMRKLEEQNQRDDYLEAIGDVTKQKDLDGFYRHIYEQKMGTSKDIKKVQLLPEITNAGDSSEGGIAYKPIISVKIQKQRTYRQRNCCDDEDEKQKEESLIEDQSKKLHISNNIDADSDFSIDDSESESEDYKKQDKQQNKTKQHSSMSEVAKTHKPALNLITSNLDTIKSEENTENTLDVVKKTPPPYKPKRDKNEIWRKRTVGAVYTAAVQRYYERKAARNQA